MTRVRTFLPFAIAVLTCITVVVLTLSIRVSKDEMTALEWARSIGTSFSYHDWEIPYSIYPSIASNGGPLMYVGGLGYAITHDIDGALVAGTLSGAIVLLIGLMLMRSWLSVLPLTLVFAWPMFAYSSTVFLAEIWAAGTALVGLAFLERMKLRLGPSTFFREPRLWWALFFFSLAIWSKMVVCFAVFGLIFATVYDQLAPRDFWQIVRNTLRSLAITVLACGIVGALFFLEFGFAIVHTVRSVDGALAVPAMFKALLTGMFGLATMGQAVHRDDSVMGHLLSVDHGIAVLTIATAIVLLISRPSYAILIGLAATIWLHFSLDERELLPTLVIILALGLREVPILIGRRFPGMNFSAPGVKALAIGLWLLYVFVGSHGSKLLGFDPQRRYGANLSNGYVHYDRALIEALKQHEYVFTVAPYVLPEIKGFWNLTFYDRRADQNAHLWNRDVVMLFDKNQFPPDNCGSTLLVEGDIVLCAARKDVPLSDQHITLPAGTAKTINLSKRPWNLGAAFFQGSGGPHGSTDYEFVGTGAASTTSESQIAVRLIVDVVPGKWYVFSSWVDPSKLGEGAAFDLYFFTAEGGTAGGGQPIIGRFWPDGPPSRYTAPPWHCPPGVHQVQLGLGTNFAPIPKGQKIRFSEPELIEITPPSISLRSLRGDQLTGVKKTLELAGVSPPPR